MEHYEHNIFGHILCEEKAGVACTSRQNDQCSSRGSSSEYRPFVPQFLRKPF